MDKIIELDVRPTIADIYSRITKLSGNEPILLLGGASIAVLFQKDRKINDIDAYWHNKTKFAEISKEEFEKNGFDPHYTNGKLDSLIDKASLIEVDFTTKPEYENVTRDKIMKMCDGNVKLGEVTLIGVDVSEIMENSMLVKIGNSTIRVPSILDTLLMKYNLWIYRGEGKTEGQKDAADIKTVIEKGLSNSLADFEAIAKQVNNRYGEKYAKMFIEDIKRIAALKSD